MGQQTVLVTGAGGFIGYRLVGALLGRNVTVRGLLGPSDPDCRWGGPRVDTFRADIRNLKAIHAMMEGVSIIVHLAGPASVRDSFRAAEHYAQVHVGGTAGLLQLACEAGTRRFVYISSAEVYGQPLENPVSEDHPLDAHSPYAAAKIGGEQFVHAFACARGIEAVTLRPFSVFGPGLSPQSLLGTILRQARNEDSIALADLRPVRDYCYVSDLVAAIISACFTPVEGRPTINIGSGTGTSVADLARTVMQATGREVPLCEAPRRDRPNGARIFELVADCRRAREWLNWRPEVPLRKGIEQTIKSIAAQ